MDYFLLSSLRRLDLCRIVISYDIACQWSRNLKSRCSTYGPNIFSDSPNLEVTYLVPKFHLPAHITKCQEEFSFNFTRHVGRTDGESPARGWAAANAIANSTKEMGPGSICKATLYDILTMISNYLSIIPGSRRDTLDDHFGDYNWRKITDLGNLKLFTFWKTS